MKNDINPLKLIVIVILIISMYYAIPIAIGFYHNQRAELEYELIQDEYADSEHINSNDPDKELILPTDTSYEDNQVEVTKEKIILKKFDSLIETNSDFVGWINIPGTCIDYPVVQTDDNDYYLRHSFNKNYLFSGAIYMDFRNKWDEIDNNVIIYGHTIKKDSMFADLNYYVEKETAQDYFWSNNSITFDTLYGNYEWDIFSAYIVELNEEDYYVFPNYEGDDFTQFIEEITSRSTIKSNLEITEGNTILTLVTCYPPIDNARTIIHALRKDKK